MRKTGMLETDKTLAELRDHIDDIDSQLIQLLKLRNELTSRVGDVKSQTGMPIYVPSRESEMIAFCLLSTCEASDD